MTEPTQPIEPSIPELRLVSPERISREPIPDISIEEIQSDEVQQQIRDMKEFLEEQGPGGVGLAAPQVGLELPIAIISFVPPPEKRKEFGEPFEATIINPTYEGIGEIIDFEEGCLTIGSDAPMAKTRRFMKIVAKWYDEHGERHEEELVGPPAIIFQHEADHIVGKLITDDSDERLQAMQESVQRAKKKMAATAVRTTVESPS